MHLGIIGPAQSGKTTLFSAATGQPLNLGHGAHRAVVKVPDGRLQALADIVKPKKITPAEVEYLDWGGVAADPSQAADSESKIPAEIRSCDALVAVIRAFESDVVPHPRGTVDPARDLNDLQTALILADLTTVETRITRLDKSLKVKKDTGNEAELNALHTCREHLENEQSLRTLELSKEVLGRLRGFGFLTSKPLLVVLNLGEDDLAEGAELEARWQEKVGDKLCTVIALCAQVEMEIAQLDEEEKAAFLTDMGISEPALGRMIRTSYGLVGLLAYFTAGDPEVRAWTVPAGATAVQAADVIHSDIARGFIRAEVVAYDEYIAGKGIPGAKQAGKFRLEGKDYVVCDGDVIYFRFNV
jgi:GTP-binding protein YchF